MFGVTVADITFQAVGPSGSLPTKTVLNYPMQGLKLEMGGKEYTAWATQNELNSETSYYVKVDGFPESILFGPYSPEEEADVFVIRLKWRIPTKGRGILVIKRNAVKGFSPCLAHSKIQMCKCEELFSIFSKRSEEFDKMYNRIFENHNQVLLLYRILGIFFIWTPAIDILNGMRKIYGKMK